MSYHGYVIRQESRLTSYTGLLSYLVQTSSVTSHSRPSNRGTNVKQVGNPQRSQLRCLIHENKKHWRMSKFYEHTNQHSNRLIEDKTSANCIHYTICLTSPSMMNLMSSRKRARYQEKRKCTAHSASHAYNTLLRHHCPKIRKSLYEAI